MADTPEDKAAAVGAALAARGWRLISAESCTGGLLAARDPAAGGERLDDNRRMLDEAAEIGAPCLVLIGGGLDPDDRDLPGARARVLERIGELVPHARATGVRIALEDLAVLTGSTLISRRLGPRLDRASLDDLGRARLVTVDESTTIIVDGAGDDVHGHAELRHRDAEQLPVAEVPGGEQDATARLQGGVDVLAAFEVGDALQLMLVE